MRSLAKLPWILVFAALVTPMASRFATPVRGESVDIESILNDPDSPVAGNPKGDITIVAFLDYNGPFCKKATPDLARLIHADGKIRLIYKDWPILSEASIYGAHLALAAKYQDKYDQVHAALMAIPGHQISKATMLAAVQTCDVDMTRLNADLLSQGADIDALLKRNLVEADSLGLEGTPVFLIGPFKVAAALDYEGFKKTVAKVRARLGN
jgi:protein-disulfide isomerase